MVIVDLTTYSTATQENFVMSLNLLNPAMLVTGNVRSQNNLAVTS